MRLTSSPFPPGSAPLLRRFEFHLGVTFSVPACLRDSPHQGTRSCRSSGSPPPPPDSSLVLPFAACAIPFGRRSERQNLGFYLQTHPRRCKTSRRISAEAPGRRCRVGRGRPAGHPLTAPGFPGALPCWSPGASDRERPLK